MKRDHQNNLFLQFVPSTSLQVNQFLFIHFSVVHLQISIVLPLTPASIRVQHLTFLLICFFVCYNLGLKLFSGELSRHNDSRPTGRSERFLSPIYLSD